MFRNDTVLILSVNKLAGDWKIDSFRMFTPYMRACFGTKLFVGFSTSGRNTIRRMFYLICSRSSPCKERNVKWTRAPSLFITFLTSSAPPKFCAPNEKLNGFYLRADRGESNMMGTAASGYTFHLQPTHPVCGWKYLEFRSRRIVEGIVYTRSGLSLVADHLKFIHFRWKST